jgi:hypothetical protein
MLTIAVPCIAYLGFDYGDAVKLLLETIRYVNSEAEAYGLSMSSTINILAITDAEFITARNSIHGLSKNPIMLQCTEEDRKLCDRKQNPLQEADHQPEL